MARYLVTITPPTPNGDLHLGHMAGPFLAADIFAKVRKLLGDDVVLVSYADDYQSYIARKAKETGENWLEISRKNANLIESTMQAIYVDVDHFMRSGENGFFAHSVQRHLDAVVDKGILRTVQGVVPYDSELDKLGYEAFARGACPRCGYSTDPSQCENCASYPDAGLMTGIHSPVTKKEIGTRTMTRTALDMGAVTSLLKQHYREVPPARQLSGFIDEYVFQGTQDLWPIDRNEDAGVPVVYQGVSMLVSTWFSGLAGYEAALAEYWSKKMRPAEAESFWKDETANLVHFLGYDCSYSHALVYPAISELLHGNLPRIRHYTNAFLKLDNEDFSTSRNYAIWARDFVAEHGADPVRLYLAMKSPEHAPENFALSDFITWKAIFEKIRRTLLETDTTSVRLSKNLVDGFQHWLQTIDLARFSIRAYAGFIWELFEEFMSCSDVDSRIEHAALIAMLSQPLMPDLSARMMDDHLIALRSEMANRSQHREAESEEV